MIRNQVLERLLENASRRSFLKGLGVLGVGVAAGGALQSVFKVLEVDGDAPAMARMRPAMGTFVEITAVHPSTDLADEAIERAFEEMERLVSILSRHDASTPLSHLNATGSLSSPPPELTAVLLSALDVHRRTRGAFDPTVKPIVDLLEASVSGKQPSDAEVRDALARVGADRIEFSDRRVGFARDGVSVTLDGVAKGFIVDRMSDVLTELGVGDHLVNAGGDIRSRGSRDPRGGGRPWTIAVEDPKKRGDYPDVIRMRDGAVATSGSYENFYGESGTRHHIIDPATGRSPLECVSVTVRAGSVMEADALSTAVFVLGSEPGTALVDASPDVESLVLDAGGRLHRSRAWKSAG